MRKIAPIIVILASLGLYAARDTVLKPFTAAEYPPEKSYTSVTPSPGSDIQIASSAPFLPHDELAASGGTGGPTVPFRTGVRAAKPVEGKIGKNSSLYVELRDAGVPPAEIQRIVNAAKKTYNLKRVRAGQKFDLYASQAGTVDSMFFYYSREEYLSVRRDGDEFEAAIDTTVYTITYHVTEGTILQSLFLTLQEQGADTDLAAHLAEIFGWSIDFFRDIHQGDSFAVLYERKAYEGESSTLGNVLAARMVSHGREYHAFRFDTGNGRYGYFDENGQSMEKSLLRAPVKYTRVTSSFSSRRYHPIRKKYQPHYGVDFGAPYGTPVYATGDGSILAATRRTGNGNYVKIKHNNTYTTYYLHLQRFAKGIRKGARVRQGQVIGYVGSTGWANGPHVCYRIKRNGSWVNPRALRLPSKSPVPESSVAFFERLRDVYLLRLNESILDNVDNHTILVERPSCSSDAPMRATF